MSAKGDREVEADIERMLAIRRNRRELGWSYYGLTNGGGHLVGNYHMSSTERSRRSRERKAAALAEAAP